MCDVESLQESLEGPPHDLRDWITLFSFFLSLLSLWFSYWLFREATHRAEPIGNSALITRWMRADWLIEIINTWQWWTSSTFQFLPFSFSSTRWNLDVWHSKRWKGSALNIQFRPFHQVQLVAVRIHWFRFVSTCVHAEYGNAEREQKSGSGYLQFLFIFWLPCCEVYIYGENAMIFSIRNCAQSQTTHESASTRFFFLPPIKKGKSCAAQMSIISPLYPFSVQVFERGGGEGRPASS